MTRACSAFVAPADGAPAPPQAEVDAVVALVETLGPAVVSVGHGRDLESVAAAHSFVAAWCARSGQIGRIVSWPAMAASWLRPASRLAADADTWVVADLPTGWRGVGPRLAATGKWRAERTVAFAGLADPELPRLAGCAATNGLCGATADGRVWHIVDGRLHTSGAVGARISVEPPLDRRQPP